MNQRIVFQPASFQVAVMAPVIPQLEKKPDGSVGPKDHQLSVLEIGQKDVPAGVPFWIVEVADIPADRTFRDAWELDEAAMGVPDGYGGTYQESAT
jgi:hypothetical protein